MDPQILLSILTSSLSVVEKVWPLAAELFKSGEISVEDQQKLMDRINALRAKANSPGPLVDDGTPS